MAKAEDTEPRLYTMYSSYGTRYAYGLPWVMMALYCDDLHFETPEEAMEWWEVNYGNNSHSGENGEEDEVFYGNETEDF